MDDISNNLQNRNITIEELNIIDANFEKMKKLYDARAQKSKQGTGHTELLSALKQRLNEFQIFSETLEYLKHLCNTLDPMICGK